MCTGEVFVDKSTTVDGVAALAAGVGDVAALDDKAVD